MKLYNKKMVGKRLAGEMQLSLYKKHFKTSIKMSKSTGVMLEKGGKMGTFYIYAVHAL